MKFLKSLVNCWICDGEYGTEIHSLRENGKTPGSHEEYFIELKGTSIMKAVSQLETTINSLSVNPKDMDKYAFIIGTNVSPKIDTERQRAIKRFSNQYKTKLVIREKKYSHPLY